MDPRVVEEHENVIQEELDGSMELDVPVNMDEGLPDVAIQSSSSSSSSSSSGIPQVGKSEAAGGNGGEWDGQEGAPGLHVQVKTLHGVQVVDKRVSVKPLVCAPVRLRACKSHNS